MLLRKHIGYFMKSKLRLLVLIIIVGFTSCKKDDQPAPDALVTIKTQIKGTWQLTDSKEVYYDAAGKVIRTNDQDVDPEAKYEFLSDTQLKRYYPSELLFDYTLSKPNDKVLLTVDEQTFEVEITNNTMSWAYQQNFQDQEYAKAAVIAHFKKLWP